LFCVSEIDSSPPATAMRCSPVMMLLAALAIATRPEAHMRSIVMPPTLSGRPGGVGAQAAEVVALVALLRGDAEHHVVDIGRRPRRPWPARRGSRGRRAPGASVSLKAPR
jgi:hypothetical protein